MCILYQVKYFDDDFGGIFTGIQQGFRTLCKWRYVHILGHCASQILQGCIFCGFFLQTQDLGLEMHSGQHSVKPEKYLMGF